MGEVYLAEHPRLPRCDALKILPRDVSADPGFRQRFTRESELAAALWHPHIVGLHDRGEFAGQLWLSMDYVEGADAAELLNSRYPAGMPPAVVVEVVAAIADALDYAHDRGLLHRDVKPANILISEPSLRTQRRILLTDFGVARRMDDINGLTQTNVTVGTPTYMAPEQLMDGPIDGCADQYALAATAFHLLTGSPPFADHNPAVVITKHLHAPPPRPGDIRPDLAGCNEPFARALAKRSTDRFARCVDFARALEHCSTSPSPSCPTTAPATATATAPSADPAPPPTAWPVRKSMTVAGAVIAVFAVGFLLLMALGLPRERTPTPPNIDVPSSQLIPPPAPEPPPAVTTVVPAETAPAPEPPETWTPPPSTTTTWEPTTTPPTSAPTTSAPASTPATSTYPTTTSVSPPLSTTPVTRTGNRPAVGTACSGGQVGMTAIANTNMTVRCVSTPSGFTWVAAGS